MISYNVFFTPKAGVEEPRVTALAHEFLTKLQTKNKIRGYRILRVTNPASFSDLPQFQAIIDYESQQELDDSMAYMRQAQKIKEGAHGELIELVTNFKVSFTIDV
ncbi:MAG TPA: DUF6614 family protein [Opitutaceae bacterium]|jgi:hypothetical protein|nr:DUF6614 family protein [Opitutaceae bacterium]